MANHPSALKRARQNVKRRDRNRGGRATNRTVVRKFTATLETDGVAAAQVLLPALMAQLAGSGAKGTIPKKRASRKIGRLARRLAASAQA